MTNTEITETIEKEFGWLSPDEKQKLNVMMVRTWNDAIVASAHKFIEFNSVPLSYIGNPDDDKDELNDKSLEYIKSSINSLKLKL